MLDTNPEQVIVNDGEYPYTIRGLMKNASCVMIMAVMPLSGLIQKKTPKHGLVGWMMASYHI